MPRTVEVRDGELAHRGPVAVKTQFHSSAPGFTFAFHTVVCGAGLEVVEVESVVAEAAEVSALSEIFGGASVADSPSSSMSTASCSKLWQIPFQDHGWYVS